MRLITWPLFGIAFAACSQVTGGVPATRLGYDPSARLPVSGLSALSQNGYKVLYSFRGGSDGYSPQDNLILASGTLYGTTSYGGYESLCYYASGGPGCGTIFKIDPSSGAQKVLYRFYGGERKHADGTFPRSNVIVLDNVLYGTTYMGGANRQCACGTIFSVTTSGKERVLKSLDGGPSGESPDSGLTPLRGDLYGTTAYGGGTCESSGYSYGCGTVFKVSTSGSFKTVYKFTGRSGDGASPKAGLLVINNNLYGTTSLGGSKDLGTVFTISSSGKERVLYRFKGRPNDGQQPSGGLTDIGGTLYGSTVYGGEDNKGIVFAITLSGKEHVVYSFKRQPDGAWPFGNLTELNGEIYGTTSVGGGPCDCGTVYALTTAGKETILHRFNGMPDGDTPFAGLAAVNGFLYGTTFSGGASNNGTVFRVSP